MVDKWQYSQTFILRNTADASLLVCFQVGFLEETRDSYSKHNRDLLASLCTVHPRLAFSHIVQFLLEYVDMTHDVAFYLLSALPWQSWQIEFENVNILASVIGRSATLGDDGGLRLNEGDSDNLYEAEEASVARSILNHVDWRGKS